MPGYEHAGGAPLIRFTEALFAAPSLKQIERVFVAGFGKLMGVSMRGFDIRNEQTLNLELSVAAGVSSVFVGRYEREVMLDDPIRRAAVDTRRGVYNRALMGEREWLESPVYRGAYYLHGIRHVIEAPMMGPDGSVIGNLHFAENDPARAFTAREVELTEAVARVIGHALAAVRTRERLEVERDRAIAALEVTEMAVVMSDPAAGEQRANRAARRIIDSIVDGEERLHQVCARSGFEERFSRRVDVELVSGRTGVLHGHTSPLGPGGGLVTVLELASEQPTVSPVVLTALTPRESEVAALVAEGLADREIATQLSLSHHTVSQYVKRIYRKLNVGSRVALTRLLLRAPGQD